LTHLFQKYKITITASKFATTSMNEYKTY